jgi:hypothetical protein
VARLGRGAERRLADNGAGFRDATLEVGVLGRVGDIEAAGNRRNGAPRPQRAGVRGGIDATGEPGDHHHRLGEFGGEILGHALAVGRGVASADQRHRTLRQRGGVAQHGDDRWCVIQHRQ